MALFSECMQRCGKKVLDKGRRCKRGDITGQSLPVFFSWFLCSGFAEDLGEAIYKPIESTALFAVNQALDAPRSQRVGKLCC